MSGTWAIGAGPFHALFRPERFAGSGTAAGPREEPPVAEAFEGASDTLAVLARSGPGEVPALSAGGRLRAHVLGVADAAAESVASAGYSFGVVGTPESRARWAQETARGAIEGLRAFLADPLQAVTGWWRQLTGNDPEAIRHATAEPAGLALGAGSAYGVARATRIAWAGSGAAFVDGKYVHSLVPRSNLELYGKAITRTPEEAKELLVRVGHPSEVVAEYRFVPLSDEGYLRRVGGLRMEFDATFGDVPGSTTWVQFSKHIASCQSDGAQKIPVYVRRGVFESDEAIVQVLSHEIHETQELKYLAHRPISVHEYASLVRPDRPNNLHWQAVLEGDARLQRFREMMGGNGAFAP
jgi:hypothetical protein